MLKPTVKRGLMLDFIQDKILVEDVVNSNRIHKLNDKELLSGDIFYVMSREFRIEDNFGFAFAKELSDKYDRVLNVVIFLDKNSYSKSQEKFLFDGLSVLKTNLDTNGIKYQESTEMPINAGAVVFDFSPIHKMSKYADKLNCAAYEVDSHNIIPARFISQKQEFSAATLRRKVYANIGGFLTEYKNHFTLKKGHSYSLLNQFVDEKLDEYAEHKNNPNKDVTSRLSPYLHFGFISSQRVALEVLKSESSRENKESFLEELIVRKELSDNFCLYSPSYNSLSAIPNWAKLSLNEHKMDLRSYTYSLSDFENSKTHDELWNWIQALLVKQGYMQGYLRMYWAKKILEWSVSPENALEIAIYLNDKYALDGCDPNGYVGILWAIGGVHDRPFGNRLVTGKIRYMSLASCQKKFNMVKYISGIKEYYFAEE